MTTVTRRQLTLLAQAAEVMTELRNAAFDTSTPKPPERIDVMPGVAALVITGNQGLRTGFYGLQIAPEGVGESQSPA